MYLSIIGIKIRRRLSAGMADDLNAVGLELFIPGSKNLFDFLGAVPSFFVSEGLSGSGKNKGLSGTSCWSWRGKELPFAPYRARKFNIIRMFLKHKELHIISFNRGKKITPETVIPIERIKAPILFVSSKHDEVWDSYKSSLIMKQTLNKAGFPYPHKHVAYKYMSHAMMTEIPFFIKLAFKTEQQNPCKCAEESVFPANRYTQLLLS